MTSILELKQRLLHPYYIIHFIYGSILPIYHIILLCQNQLLIDTNKNALLLLTGLSVWKTFIASSAEELASVVILYTKVYTLWSIYWHTTFWKTTFYVIGWVVLSAVFSQPWYRGPTKIVELSETSFRQRVHSPKIKSSSSTTSTSTPISEIKGPRIVEITSDDELEEQNNNNNNNNKDKNDKDDHNNKKDENVRYWIVMLYANWSVSCLNFEAVLAKLSLKYDANHIKFGKIDVDVYTDIAQEFGISRDPASFDLPTLLLFQNGSEIRRLPELNLSENISNATTAKNTITRLGWSKTPSTIINAFQLDKILSE